MKSVAAFGGACAALCGGAMAQGERAAAERDIARLRPVVVETFVSQSCSQSPPAAALLASLTDRPDVVALTWHVDYWDKIPAVKVGVWKDPYARPAFGARQLAYNERIRGRAMKMTPQTVIDGVISVAGATRETLEKRIVEAQFLDEMARPTPPVLDLAREDDGTIRTRIDNVGAPYDALVVNFRPAAATEIAGGDNAGKVFREANVVRAVSTLATGHTGAGEFSFSAPARGLDCAVIVQEKGHGRIVSARYCSAGVPE